MNAGTTTSQVVARIKRAGPDHWWRHGDFADLDVSPATLDVILSRLARRGQLQRVHRGLYWNGRKSRFGVVPPSGDDTAMHVAAVDGVGPAGLSAANDLGLTTQVPGQSLVAVPRRAPRPIPRVKFVDRSTRIGRVVQKLTWTEVAVLEVLDSWDRAVELPDDQAIDVLVKLMKSGDVRVVKLVAASNYESPATRLRLGALLEAAGMSSTATKIAKPRSPMARKAQRVDA